MPNKIGEGAWLRIVPRRIVVTLAPDFHSVLGRCASLGLPRSSMVLPIRLID